MQGYAPMTPDFGSFFIRRIARRGADSIDSPITGLPGRNVQLIDRCMEDVHGTITFPGTTTRAINIGSYNYLGFAERTGGCPDVVEESIRRYGISSCGARLEVGSSDLHGVAETLVASYVGHEDAIITSMGYMTNSTSFLALVGPGCLIISDELNHVSIKIGMRLSGATRRVFKHNDMHHLEALLREAIGQGQPETRAPWRKILVAVEGLYSMEGTLLDLPGIMKLKKRYKVRAALPCCTTLTATSS